ncbi:MAG: restriction endonuclease subunit S [Phascolarctobacterium sp.]|nr:restriction endonuclease subunit S [Phascolarctobacterium sp.]
MKTNYCAIKDLKLYISDGNYSEKYPRSDEFVSSGIPFLRANNISHDTIIDQDLYYITDEKHQELLKGHVRTGDILLTTRGNIGQAAIVPSRHNNSNINAQIVLLRVDGEEVDNHYLLYALQSEDAKRQYDTLQTGTALKQLPIGRLMQVKVNMPEIAEQRWIANVIKKCNKLIFLRKQQLKKLDEFVKARFVEMFGSNGNQVPLMDYVWFQEGPGVRTVDFTETGTILLTGSNINDNKITFGHKSDRHISNELAMGKYAHFMCDKDDVLVVSSAIDPIKFDKKVVVVDEDKKYCLNTGIIRFKPNKRYLTLGYFREFLKTDYFKNQVSSEMHGIAQMHFGPSHLKQMTILLPDSINLQIEFEEFVQQIYKSKLSVQKSLDKLEILKKVLMQKYFG